MCNRGDHEGGESQRLANSAPRSAFSPHFAAYVHEAGAQTSFSSTAANPAAALAPSLTPSPPSTPFI